MRKSATMRGIRWATILMSFILVIGIMGSVIMQLYIFRYAVEVLTFAMTGLLLFVGGCMYARQPLEDSKRYDDEGNPMRSWRVALMGLSLMVASVILFLYGFLFTIISITIGI